MIQTEFAYMAEMSRQVTVLGVPVTQTFLHDSHITVEELGDPYAGDTFIYVVHLHTKIARAQHYIGSTNDLARRMQQHRRTWPLYQLTDDVRDGLLALMPPSVLGKLRSIWGRKYRRKHTFLNAVHRCIGLECFDLPLLKAARRHRSNGLLMTANQRSIPWCVSRCFLAAREFEFKLKQQHKIRPFCPVCQGSYVPF